ncbi:unnamed protein product, partial [marine sediment metagenome]
AIREAADCPPPADPEPLPGCYELSTSRVPAWQGNYRVRLYDDGALVEFILGGETVASMRT